MFARYSGRVGFAAFPRLTYEKSFAAGLLTKADERGPCLHSNVGKVLQHLVQVLEDAACSAYHLDYHAMLAVRFNLNPLAR
jgi:hypothetical protein